nr:radical SAM protein [Deinococcus aestuarii]
MRVEVLRACPLTCAHCSAFAAPRHPLALPLARTLDLVSEFARLGGRRLTLTGGEPLEYVGFDEVVARARREGLAVRVFSSGVVWQAGVRTSVPPGRLAALTRVVDTLVVSLYSPDPVRHDAVTGVDGSFDLTVETVRAALALGLRTELHFVPTRLNRHELPGLAALAVALGVPRISVLRFVPQGRGAHGQDRLTLDQAGYRALRDTVLDLRSAHPGLEIALGSAHAFLGLEGCGPCTAALDQLLVEADGRVAPCSAFGDFRLPGDHDNVLSASLRDVWGRSRLLGAVREAHRVAPGCTGCLAQKALSTGRLDPRDPDPLNLGADAARVA